MEYFDHVFVMHNFRLNFLVAKEFGLFIIRAHAHLMLTHLSWLMMKMNIMHTLL
jgi:hypothetical protein